MKTKNKIQHTPGPWNIELPDYENIDIQANDGTIVCAIYKGIDNPEPEQAEATANAKLISASPDMLKALEMAKAWFENQFNAAKNGQEHFDIDLIEAAINKATGK